MKRIHQRVKSAKRKAQSARRKALTGWRLRVSWSRFGPRPQAEEAKHGDQREAEHVLPTPNPQMPAERLPIQLPGVSLVAMRKTFHAQRPDMKGHQAQPITFAS